MQIIISHPVGISPVRLHFTPSRLAKMKKSDEVKCWQERTPEHLYFAVGSLNWNTDFWKQSGISGEIEDAHTCDPAPSLLGIEGSGQTLAHVFLGTRQGHLEQHEEKPKFPSTGECIQQL